MRRTTKALAMFAATATLTWSGGGIAFADNAISDGDALAALADSNWDVGRVCTGATEQRSVRVALNRNGSGTNVYKDSSSVSVTRTVSGPLVVEAGPKSIPVPADWSTAANNTASPVVTFTVDYTAPATPGAFSGSVTWAASGVNSSNATLTRTDTLTVTGTATNCAVADTTAPTLTLPTNITGVEATDAAGAAVNYTASASDAAPLSPSVTCSEASGATFALGTTTVNCSATDAAGNTAMGSFTVTVVDTTDPVLSLPSGMSGIAADSASGSVVTYTATASDTVSGTRTVICDRASSSTFPIATTTVNCEATDAAGNTATGSFTVQVTDQSVPVLSLPVNIIGQEATGPAGTQVSFTATSTDFDPATPTVSCDPDSGTTFALNTTTVECSATDAAGNTANGSFTVTVVDTTGPALTLPDNIGPLEATGPDGAVATYTASANDLVNGASSVSCSQASGTAFVLGTTTVTCSSTDDTGNSSNGSFTVTVRDTTGPALDLPEDLSPEATSASGAVVNYTASADDIVDGGVPVSCTPESGTAFALDVPTTVNCSATDASDNPSMGSFNVTVVDTTAPVLTLPSNITGAEATGPGGKVVTYSATAVDAVDGATSVTCIPASGSTFVIGTTRVNCSSADVRSHASSGSFTVQVVDTTGPALTLPSNISGVEATGPTGAAVTYSASASDLVAGATTVSCSPASASTFALGATTVNCSSTDGANVSGGHFTVQVVDTTKPTNITFTPATMAGQTYLPSQVPTTAPSCTATDLVSTPTCVVTGFSAPTSAGLHTLTATATDALGNSDTATLTYTVQQLTLSTFGAPVDGGGVWNAIKGGNTVPLKFTLKQGSAAITSTTGITFVANRVNCLSGGEDAIEEFATTGKTELRYDTTASQFIQNWKTPTGANTCYKVTVSHADASAPVSALFKIK